MGAYLDNNTMVDLLVFNRTLIWTLKNICHVLHKYRGNQFDQSRLPDIGK